MYGSPAVNASLLSDDPSCYKCSNKTRSYIDSLKHDLYKRIELEVNKGNRNKIHPLIPALKSSKSDFLIEMPLAGLDFTSKRLSQESGSLVALNRTENFDMLYSALSDDNSSKLKSSQKNVDLMNSLRNKFLI